MKVAIVQDYFHVYGGAERCIQSFVTLFPQADFLALFDFLHQQDRQKILNGKQTKTTFIQHLPFAKTKHSLYFPLFPKAIENLDFSPYDLIISSSYMVAKGIKTTENQLHICYMHTPPRFAWDYFEHYQKEYKMNFFLQKLYSFYVKKFKNWDLKTAKNPNYIIANSQYVADKIHKIYNRKAKVIFPPVNINNFSISAERENYYITVSRLLPHKKIDLIVETFNTMPEKELIICGTGKDEIRLKKLAKSNIIFKNYLSDNELNNTLQKARAFVFASEEDFGIAPVEAQACGIPVIAFGKGGATESIQGIFANEDIVQQHHTGIFFRNQTIESLQKAIIFFEENETVFEKNNIRNNALQFSTEIFEAQMAQFINECLQNHNNK